MVLLQLTHYRLKRWQRKERKGHLP